MKHFNIAMILAVVSFTGAGFSLAQTTYPNGRPSATLRLEAKDQGVVLKHGDGPGQCDYLGAREALIFEEKGVYHLFYDGAGPKGWLAVRIFDNYIQVPWVHDLCNDRQTCLLPCLREILQPFFPQALK